MSVYESAALLVVGMLILGALAKGFDLILRALFGE